MVEEGAHFVTKGEVGRQESKRGSGGGVAQTGGRQLMVAEARAEESAEKGAEVRKNE